LIPTKGVFKHPLRDGRSGSREQKRKKNSYSCICD
jgi:hypothetical protein